MHRMESAESTCARSSVVAVLILILLTSCRPSTPGSVPPRHENEPFFAPRADSDPPCADAFEFVELVESRSMRPALQIDQEDGRHRIRRDGRTVCFLSPPARPYGPQASILEERSGAALVGVPTDHDTIELTLVTPDECRRIPIQATAYDPHRPSLAAAAGDEWIVAVPTISTASSAGVRTTLVHVGLDGTTSVGATLDGVDEAEIGVIRGRQSILTATRGRLSLSVDGVGTHPLDLPLPRRSFALRPLAVVGTEGGAWVVAKVDFQLDHGADQPNRWIFLRLDRSFRIVARAAARPADVHSRLGDVRVSGESLEIEAIGPEGVRRRIRLEPAGECREGAGDACSPSVHALADAADRSTGRPTDEAWRDAFEQESIRFARPIRVGDHREVLTFSFYDEESRATPAVYSIGDDGRAELVRRLPPLGPASGFDTLSIFADRGRRGACAVGSGNVFLLDEEFAVSWSAEGSFDRCVAIRTETHYLIFAREIVPNSYTSGGPQQLGLVSLAIAAGDASRVARRVFTTEPVEIIAYGPDSNGAWLVTSEFGTNRFSLTRFDDAGNVLEDQRALAVLHGVTEIEVVETEHGPALSFRTDEAFGMVPFCRVGDVSDTR